MVKLPVSAVIVMPVRSRIIVIPGVIIIIVPRHNYSGIVVVIIVMPITNWGI
jgi:hypothetical protein